MWDEEHDRRKRKAMKIERALKKQRGDLAGAHIVDIGLGSGFILQYLRDSNGDVRVTGIDVGDYRAEQAQDVPLVVAGESGAIPLEDQSADIVLSNFMIEHMASPDAQALHLREVARILKPDGFAYLAAPNAWWILESHTGVPFATWLPHKTQQRFVSWWIGETWMEVWTPTRRKLQNWARNAGLRSTEITLETMRELADVEGFRGLKRLICKAPRWMLFPVWWLIPSVIYILRPRSAS